MKYIATKHTLDIEDSIGYASWFALDINMFIEVYGGRLGTLHSYDFLIAVF